MLAFHLAMNKAQVLATTAGFLISSVVELLLPSTQTKLIGVSASPEAQFSIWQGSSDITNDSGTSPRFSNDNFKIGLQIGHEHDGPLPTELSSLKGNTGAQAGDKTEVESNRRIVRELTKLLEKEGLAVDVLPAVLPKRYQADLFLTIHADGSPRAEATGWKMAASAYDQTSKAGRIVELLNEEYPKATRMRHDYTNITSNMRNYYSFNHRSFEHAVHPATPAAIIETGFITSPKDQALIYDNPHIPARGIAQAVIRYFEQEKLDRQAEIAPPVFQPIRRD